MAANVRSLTDGELVAALDDLAVSHRQLIANMVAHLAEVERRRLYLGLGYSSMYAYATGRLGLSEHEAYLRIAAARAAEGRAEVLDGLERGELSLTTLKLISPHLAAYPELLSVAAGKSKREVEHLVAELSSNSVRTELRLRAVSGDRIEITCVVSRSTAELLEQALDASMHENPERDPDQLLEAALRLLLAKKRRPRGSVPAKAERKVEGPSRCAFVGADGHVCEETRFLQLDHIVPRAQGGTDEPENLRWLCGPHNRFEAMRKLGPDLAPFRVLARRQELGPDQVRGYARMPDPAAGRTQAQLGPDRVPVQQGHSGRKRADFQHQVQSALVNMGFRAPQARRAAYAACVQAPPNIEYALRSALASLSPTKSSARERSDRYSRSTRHSGAHLAGAGAG